MNAIVTTIATCDSPSRCYACAGEISVGEPYVRVETLRGRYARLYCSARCAAGEAPEPEVKGG